ncbi:MAG: helix-turn-helix domain-containing protein [Bacteroidetes bacterium]|nr:MAG: helix-turn-helix domain-containing protein [Bacteroidota bacterium]
MVNLGNILREKRLSNGQKIKDISHAAKIDQAIISKIENGSRMPTEKQLPILAKAYGVSYKELKNELLIQKVIDIVQYSEAPDTILSAAESRIEYLRHEQKPGKIELSADLLKQLESLDLLKARWVAQKPLAGIQLSKLQEYFNIKNTFESNRIEGNTLTYQETQLVVNEGLTIGGKPLKDHLEAINHAEAVTYIYELVQGYPEFDKRVLLDIHRLILKSIDSRNAGCYRSVPVRISGSEHIPPQPFMVPKMMEDYFTHYQNIKDQIHPIIVAAEMHERLVSIHPFIDGNGRTSRLVMNVILMQHGYPITYLKGDNPSRLKYYQTLEKVQVDNDPVPFYMLIIERVRESLLEHLEMV